MSACSISLCPWKYNLALSSLRLFKAFSQHSPPNSEPCFLSFSFTTHYGGHVEETVFREERGSRGEGGGRGWVQEKWEETEKKKKEKIFKMNAWMNERVTEKERIQSVLNMTTAAWCLM